MKIYRTNYTDGTTQFSFVENVDKTYLFVESGGSMFMRDRSVCIWKDYFSLSKEFQHKVTLSNELEVLIMLGHTAEHELKLIKESIKSGTTWKWVK